MHPVGIKFGLNLLQFPGGDVVIADRFFEEISAAARRRKCALPSPFSCPCAGLGAEPFVTEKGPFIT